jgi:hypothetical protein
VVANNQSCESTAPSSSLALREQTNSIQIEDSSIVLELSSVIIAHPFPFLSLHSNVTVIQSGARLLVGTESGSCGIECGKFSALVFLTFTDHGSVASFGSSGGCGIGSGVKGTCVSLHFVNGSYLSQAGANGGSGIGSGHASSGQTSEVGSILIYTGTFTRIVSAGSEI